MGHDLTDKARLQAHYRLSSPGPLVYCYIRKNGCSAFKAMFAALSEARPLPASGQEMGFMVRHHRPTAEEVTATPIRILVLRNPFDRMASAFLNQYVMRLGRNESELHRHVAETLGCDTGAVNFADFIKGYVLALPEKELDRHVQRQSSHVLPMTYSHATRLKDLAATMTDILGSDLAERFFAKPVNSTHRFGTRALEDAATTPAASLAEAFARDHVLPRKADLLSEAVRADLAPFLAPDIVLWRQLSDVLGDDRAFGALTPRL